MPIRRLLGFWLGALMLMATGGALAQQDIASPVPAVLRQPTLEEALAVEPTPTTAPTQTPLPSARLEALASAGQVNVRALPDVDSELLGTIAQGTAYPALRQYFRWYEFSYDLSPNGRAWVYGDLVSVAGDLTRLVTVDDFAEIARGLDGAQAQAEERTIDLATAPAAGGQAAIALAASPLPTYTAPAATQAPFGWQIEAATASDEPLGNFPPILPILAMGGAGLLGLLISLLRR